jgi:prephenate dehydrogenase
MQLKRTHTCFSSVTIIGLGLIGGSMARLIRHHLPNTYLYGLDIRGNILQESLLANAIDCPLASLSDPNLYQSDLILLTAHVYQNIDLLKEIVQRASKPIRVMDLGSTKQSICRVAETLPEEFSFIGGHPLAGREVSGFVNSRRDLFSDKLFLLTPCAKTPELFQSDIMHWLKQLGTRPAVMPVHQHDVLMALVSHFPQFYAVALANLLTEYNPQETLRFLGGGIDDQMRLMASPYEMWRDVFQDNQQNLDEILSRFIALLQNMQQALRNDRLESWFDKSHEIHALYQSYKAEKNN